MAQDASAGFQPAQDASAGFQPPEDAPRAADDSARLVHTEHAAEVLRVLVKDQLELSPDARASARQRGLCVGLLGGLGQGKTEAVYAARRWLLDNSAVSTFIWFRRRPNIVFFDIANHSSEALEFRFAQLQAALNPWNWLLKLMAKSFLLAILIVGLVTATIWAVLSFSTGPAALVFTGHDLGKFPDWGLLGTALRMLLFPWLGWVGFKAVSATALQRREMALFWTVGQAGPQASWMKRNLSAWISSLRRIDVLIVDNLDRASIAQQRAILRSLYKARGGLPYCVVVAFDEQALLHASPDPEAPEALLHKALQVQVRLAPRHPVEAVPLAYLAAESLPLPEWKQAFEQHEVIAVFARVLAQMPSLSPRLAKRFVADVGVGLRVIEKNLLEPESTHATLDFVASPMSLVMQHAPALFRLRGLEELCPGLWRNADQLAQCLAGHLTALTWQAELIEAMEKKEAPANIRRALRFIDLTRDLQPTRGDWASYVMVLWGGRWSMGQSGAPAQGLAPSNIAFGSTAPALLPLHHVWRTLDLATHVGVADNLDLQAFASFWAFSRNELLQMFDDKDIDLPDTHALAADWLALVLDLWVDHRPDVTARAAALLQLRRALVAPGSWLATESPPIRQRLCSVLAAVALRSGACPAEPDELIDWLDLDALAPDHVRLQRLALCDPEGLDGCHVWALVSPPTIQIEGTSPPQRPFDNELVVSWLHRVKEPVDPASVATMCKTLIGRGRLSRPVADLLAAAWPRLALAASAANLTPLHLDLLMCLRTSPSVADLSLPSSFVAAVQRGAYRGADVWRFMCAHPSATTSAWSLTAAVELIVACKGLARPPSDWHNLAEWNLPAHAYRGYLLWAALLDQAIFQRALMSRRHASEGIQNAFIDEESLQLLHQALVDAQDDWTASAEHECWLKETVFGPHLAQITASSELSELPLYRRLFAVELAIAGRHLSAPASLPSYDPFNLPILFIHGLIGTWDVLGLADQFLAFKCLAPDLKGYGANRDVTGPIDLSSQVDHLVSILESEFPDPEQKVHVVAHSIGGVVAIMLAEKRPNQVGSLVMVESNFTPDDAFWCKGLAQKSLSEVEADLARWRKNPDVLFADLSLEGRGEKLRTAGQWLYRQDARVLRELAISVVDTTFANDYESRVQKVADKHPIHLIAGARSAASWHPFAWLKNAAPFNVVPDAGHMLMLDNPLATASLIRTALLPPIEDVEALVP